MYTQPMVSILKLGANGSNFKRILGVLAGNVAEVVLHGLEDKSCKSKPAALYRRGPTIMYTLLV